MCVIRRKHPVKDFCLLLNYAHLIYTYFLLNFCYVGLCVRFLKFAGAVTERGASNRVIELRSSIVT